MQERTKSQPLADIFTFGGMGDNLMKAIVLIGDKVVGKAIAIRTCIRSEGNWGLELRLKKICEATPSRASGNAHLQSRIQTVFLLDLYVEKGKLI